MRVVLVSKALVVGSYQRKAELLAAQPDVELTVAVPPLWRDGDLERRLERAHTDGYELVETPIFRPGNFHLHFYPRLGQVLTAAKPDVVHVDEEPYNLATHVALADARRRGARTLFFTWQNLQRVYPLPFSWFERSAHRHVDGAIVGSRTAGEVLRAKGYDGRMWCIPQFGVDTQSYSPPTGPAPTRPFTVGYAGRLVWAKGVDLLIEALADIRSDWRLEIVGDGPEREALEALARMCGVGSRVRFTPWLPSADMPEHYRGLDVLVLPSRSTNQWVEQFGRVLTEAMACGVACVGSDSGEIPHVLGNAGMVFREGDAAALRVVLKSLASEPGLRAKLSQAGRQRVLDRFTMERVASDTAAAYRVVMGIDAAEA